jgi:hypothetical protein
LGKYQIHPTPLATPCVTLFENPLRGLMTELGLDKELGICRVTLLFPYAVDNALYYRSEGQRYPVFFVRRMEGVPLLESTLGLTENAGLGSMVFVDRAETYVIESVVPSLTPRGYSLITPTARGVSKLEEEAAAAVRWSLYLLYGDTSPEAETQTPRLLLGPSAATQLTSVALTAIRQYADQLVGSEDLLMRARMRQITFGMGHRPPPGNNFVELFGLEALSGWLGAPDGADLAQSSLQDVRPLAPPVELGVLKHRMEQLIAQHEVQHQIMEAQRKQRGHSSAQAPAWLATQSLPKGVPAEAVAEEAAAYLIELVRGAKLRHFLLTRTVAFALNPYAEQAPEHYVARILLCALLQRSVSNASSLRIDEIVSLYRATLQRSDRALGEAAENAYLALFGVPAPMIEREP